MRMASTTARTVEALHVLVLLIFAIWAPLCFRFQDEAAAAEASTPIDSSSAVDGAAAFAEEVAALPRLAWSTAQAPRSEGSCDEAPSAIPVAVAGGSVPSAVGPVAAPQLQIEEPLKRGCGAEEPGRWTILPFLVALIGGGVFSLEAFEAFPML